MKDSITRLEAIFNTAKELPTPEQKEVYLRDACKDAPDLRSKVEALLRASEQSVDAFQTKPSQGETILAQGEIAEGPGSSIGRYKLLQQIGEGGMGIVFMAEQTEPVRRKVALKIIKLGMDTKSVVARFEAERQALALMDHPNIAKVLDAGSTETGRPYFVMELVKGVPIHTYCDKNQLPTCDRLKLFAQVCQSIQHAHQKGVIHRDIKPSNILVTLHDGKPVPKVIDFGIAKATNQRLTEKTLFTNFAQMIGTPAYMSPEQAEMSGLDVDTRTDVYSLGVLLYELLTGTTPFPEKELLSKGYGEMQRIISEQEPERPSLRMSTLVGEQQTIVTKSRAGDLALLTRQLTGDLDWIVMKTLEKDRTRRYETASGLAEDIHRHLRNEAVLAARPSFRYQIVKTYQRNKPAFAAGFAIAAILIISSIVSTALAIRAQREEQKSRAAKETAETLNDFVFGELIGLADPENNAQRSLTLLDALDQIDERISQNFTDRPELEIEARLALGRAFVFRFDSERSAKHLKRAYELSREQYGDADLRTLITGRTYLYSWLWRENAEIPEEDFQVTIPRLYQGATTLFEPENPHYYMCHLIETWRLIQERKSAQGWELLATTEAQYDAIRKIDPIQANLNLLQLAQMKHNRRKFDDAKKYFQVALAGFLAESGNKFPLTLFTRLGFAYSLFHCGEVERAIHELETILGDGKDIFMNPAFMTKASTKLLVFYYHIGDDEKAESLARQVLDESTTEYDVQRFLASRYYDNAARLSHEEAKTSGAWSKSLQGLLSIAEASGVPLSAWDFTYELAHCHYHLGNHDEHYEMLRELPIGSKILALRAMNRAAIGDWETAHQESREALKAASAESGGGRIQPYADVIAGLVALNRGDRDAWIRSCTRIIPQFQELGFFQIRYLVACLGQKERLPESLETEAIEQAEAYYNNNRDLNDSRGRSSSSMAGGLAAWRKGQYKKAIKRLEEWPYRTNPLQTSGRYFASERYQFRAETAQHLLIANCYARLNQIDRAKKHLGLSDKVREPISYDWWAPLILRGMRSETEELIQSAEN